MQSHDNAIELVGRKRLLGRGIRVTTRQDPKHPNPTFLPVANDAAQRLADYVGGIAQSSVTEALLNVPTTAHLLGGCAIGSDRSSGVVDSTHRVFGYANLLVVDGAAMPANVGVNPSLTITAMAERAMAQMPQRELSGDPSASRAGNVGPLPENASY
jgi:cholesterol oxidase